MMANLKVDIIYYKTSGDFELEFNLSGCCRMRILKDNIDNRRDLVNTLARDVSRSRIIIMVSDLFGEKNGVETLCAATGYKYVSVDKAAYSIKSGDNISMPAGALPLVTKSGQYGGFIVECGKQSIIVVSSDRNLRHEIMRSYIHQYVFDINQVDAYNERLKHESQHNPIIENSNILSSARQELPTEQSVSLEPTEESVSVEASEGVILPDSVGTSTADNEQSSQEEVTNNDDSEESNIETEKDEESKYNDTVNDIITLTNNETIPTSTTDFLVNDNSNPANKRLVRRRKGSNIVLLIVAILLLACFGVLAYYFVYLPLFNGNNDNTVIKLLEDLL